MPALPVPLYSAAQTRELDRLASEQLGVSVDTLMARAGQAAFNLIKAQWPAARHLAIFCGPGHNGGDGLVLAKLAAEHGYQLSVYQLADDKPLAAATAAAQAQLIQVGASVLPCPAHLPACDLIVDALLGTGINRAVEAEFATVIGLINQAAPIPVLSLDIPSGLHADSGQALGTAVMATKTLSFLGLNAGLLTGEGPDFCGALYFADLDVPETIHQAITPIAQQLQFEQFKPLLTPRKRSAHKGLYGHVWLVGGDQGMSGAIRMAAEASLRVGAGLVSVATHPSHAAFVNIGRPELMCHGVETPHHLTSLLWSCKGLALGPGLGQSDWGKALFQAALQLDMAMVIDADGLNLLSQSVEQRDNWILTPHPGEAARLLGCRTAEIQQDRFAAVKALQQKYGGVVVLKGAGTLIYDGHVPVQLSPFGNPGMSSGGMGDVLTGIIAGLLAQQFSLFHAACFGVVLHALAADQGAQQAGEKGLLAMDLMPALQRLINLREDRA